MRWQIWQRELGEERQRMQAVRVEKRSMFPTRLGRRSAADAARVTRMLTKRISLQHADLALPPALLVATRPLGADVRRPGGSSAPS